MIIPIKFFESMPSIPFTSRKTNMTMKNQPWIKMYLLLKMVIFQPHMGFHTAIPHVPRSPGNPKDTNTAKSPQDTTGSEKG